MRFDRPTFFNQFRVWMGGTLEQATVDSMTAKLDIWEHSYSTTDLRFLANALGQNRIETPKMCPIKELGGNAYLMKNYDRSGSNPKRAIAMGNTRIGDGALFCGRGDVQVTWADNYRYFGKLLGLDLYNKPDLMLDPKISASVMYLGMMSGHFTGRKLSQYFSPTVNDPFNARSIINGDKNVKRGGILIGTLLTRYHNDMLRILTAAARY